MTRYLIVNADDFGMSEGVNRGIVRTYEHGIVTSTSLMVRRPAAAQAAAYVLENPGLSAGLHVELGDWEFADGEWKATLELVDTDDRAAVATEVERQLEAFRSLVGRDPTHLDSHQHVHRNEPVASVAIEAGRALGVPVRHFHPRVRYAGDFYGQSSDGSPLPEAIHVEALLDVLVNLEAGVTELGCHPGEAVDLQSSYRDEREQEVETLCDPQVRATLVAQGIVLRSFANVFSDLFPAREAG